MHWRLQGDMGEVSALEWVIAQGWRAYLPLGHSEDCALIADMGGYLVRVQVKTSNYYLRGR